jgi:hypothetical protein
LLHKIIRAHYNGEIVTDALPDPTNPKLQCIQALMAQAAKGMGRRVERWPEGRAPYLRFALYKQNVDTMEAVRNLAMAMKVRSTYILICGGRLVWSSVFDAASHVLLGGVCRLAISCSLTPAPKTVAA